MNSLRKENFEHFMRGPLRKFKFIGIDFDLDEQKSMVWMKWISMFGLAMAVILQTAYAATVDRNDPTFAASIVYVFYFSVTLGKMIAVAYYRKNLIKCYQNLETAYPMESFESKYQLKVFLRKFTYTENFLSYFFHIIMMVYISETIYSSIMAWIRTGSYGYKMSLYIKYPVPVRESLIEYLIGFPTELFVSYTVGYTLLSCDTCLFSFLNQLSLHFKWIERRILDLRPEEPESVNTLKDIIKQHQNVLDMAVEINTVFAPPIIFSVMSSSFILCFTLYQMLDDIPFLDAFKLFLLICYEMKQVVITCYFGDQLENRSSAVFDALYMHDWHLGGALYRKLVLFMMMRTIKPISLRIAGVSNISLVTLQQVYSMSYQIFAVLKTA